jgi:hypothetical protein
MTIEKKPKNQTNVVKSTRTVSSRTTAKAPVKASDYDVAKKHIMAAIDVLGKSAKAGDKHAKETIANLGVVVCDLTK